MKVCKRCQKAKPDSEFAKARTCKGGIDSKCKGCRKILRIEKTGIFRPVCWLQKPCRLCGEEKPLSSFVRRKDSFDGRNGRCKECVYKDSRKSGWDAAYYARLKANEERLTKRRQHYTAYVRRVRSQDVERTRKQRQAERAKAAAKKGKPYFPGGPQAALLTRLKGIQERPSPQLLEQNAIQAWEHWLKSKAPDEWVSAYWESKGEPWRNPRISEAERYRLQYNHDPSFQIRERLRRQLNKARKRDGIADVMRAAIQNGGRSETVERLLGYSIDKLKHHLEKQFTAGMTWDKFMNGEIHIDHIVPQACFNLGCDDDWRACWCLSNLRPAWARDNLSKSGKRVYLL